MRTIDWDKRYREGFYGGATEAHPLLIKFWTAISGRYVADIAMGNGRDALFLSDKGFFVSGIEGSMEAVGMAKKTMTERGLRIWPIFGDAKCLPYRKNAFDCVIVFYFLKREIMGEVVTLLKNGGVLICETFLKRQNDIDRPRNPDYLLDDGELFDYFKGLELLFYEETIEIVGGRKRATARAVGRRR
jgi:tellurite methyltransferase